MKPNKRGRGAVARLFALSLALVATTALAKTDFTIQDMMGVPFPGDLLAAPKGSLVAWIANEKGARNVWVGDVAGRTPGHRVTSYSGDDGSDLEELNWDPSGRQIFYVHGGNAEAGPPINIMGLPSGPPRQEIFEISADGGEPKRIADGHTPIASPKGDQLAYILADQVWIAPLTGDQKPSQLIKDRGRCRTVVWSHDGSKLAFASSRGDHSLIGIYDFAKKTITWLQPSVDGDRSFAWSPDDRQIAYIRIPTGAGGSPFAPHLEGEPWSIWVADPATGKGRKVWTADRGPGSLFHGLLSGEQLVWTAQNRFVFPWEKTGWNRLYSVSVTGGKAELLTPGNAEVFNASVTPDGTKVIYSSNQEDDTDRVHLFEASTAGGGAAKLLTKDKGIEDYPVVADGVVAMLHSDARLPMRAAVLVSDGKIKDLAPDAIPANFPASKMVDPEGIVFTSPDGMKIHGQLFVPPGNRRAKGPALLFFHGGPIREMFLGWHPMDAYAYFYGMNQYLANKGYVVLSVNYRGGIGYGLKFREPDKFGMTGSSELQDILGGIQFLRERSDVDPKKIGIYGGSYGGLMTALGLARASDQLAVGVDYAGVHDWKTMIPNLTAAGADPSMAQTAYDSSAIATVDKWTSPVLLIHADDDRNVPFAQTTEIVRALREQGKAQFEQIIIPNEIHDLMRHSSWITFFEATDEFFNRYIPTGR